MIRGIYIRFTRHLAAATSKYFQAKLFVHKPTKSQPVHYDPAVTSYLNTQYAGTKNHSSTSVLLAVLKASIYIFLAALLFGVISSATSKSNEEKSLRALQPFEAAIGGHFE